MNQQDVFEYKAKWKENAEVVNIRGNFKQAQDWCKQNLYMQDWHSIKHDMPDDSHNFLFKYPEQAMLFKLTNT